MVRLHPREESVWEIVDYKEIVPTPTYSDEAAENLDVLRVYSHQVSGTYVFDMTHADYRCAPALRFARRQLLKGLSKDGWNIFLIESWQITKLRNTDQKHHRVQIHYRARPASALLLPLNQRHPGSVNSDDLLKAQDPPYINIVDMVEPENNILIPSPKSNPSNLPIPSTPPPRSPRSRSRCPSTSSPSPSNSSSSSSSPQQQRRSFLGIGLGMNMNFRRRSRSGSCSSSSSSDESTPPTSAEPTSPKRRSSWFMGPLKV